MVEITSHVTFLIYLVSLNPGMPWNCGSFLVPKETSLLSTLSISPANVKTYAKPKVLAKAALEIEGQILRVWELFIQPDHTALWAVLEEGTKES